MVKNPFTPDGYTERFDMERLREIADMAAAHQQGLPNSIPDGSFSDFECLVWQLMSDLYRWGQHDPVEDSADVKRISKALRRYRQGFFTLEETKRLVCDALDSIGG